MENNVGHWIKSMKNNRNDNVKVDMWGYIIRHEYGYRDINNWGGLGVASITGRMREHRRRRFENDERLDGN